MSEPVIDIELDVPREIRGIIEPAIQEFLWLFPLWVQTICVAYVGKDEDYILEMTILTDYRYARLKVTPAILKYTDWEQREMVIHEIVHSFTTPLAAAAKNAIIDLDADAKLQTILNRRINEVTESITQDFAFCIARKFRK